MKKELSNIQVVVHGYSTRHGQGGWAATLFSFLTLKYVQHNGGAIKNASGDHMLILAAVHGLGSLKRRCNVTLITEHNVLEKIIEHGYVIDRFKPLIDELKHLLEMHNVQMKYVDKHTESNSDPLVYDLVHKSIQEAKERYAFNKDILDRIPNHF